MSKATTMIEKYEFLKKQMFKAIFNKNNPSINTKRVNKIAEQMRYLEKQGVLSAILAEVKPNKA